MPNHIQHIYQRTHTHSWSRSDWTMLSCIKPWKNSPIKIHLSIMQFLRLNERMALCVCKSTWLNGPPLQCLYSYVSNVLSFSHTDTHTFTHSVTLTISQISTVYMYDVVLCTVCTACMHLQSFIVLGYSKFLRSNGKLFLAFIIWCQVSQHIV